MQLLSGVCLILTIAFTAYCESVNITGTVTNKNSKPIPGACVFLLGKGLTDTTNAKGEFAFIAGVSGLSPLPTAHSSKQVSLNGNRLLLNLARPASVKVELFDMNGRLLRRLVNDRSQPGSYQFDIVPEPLTVTMATLRVSLGQRASTFRFIPFRGSAMHSSNDVLSPIGNGLAKVQANVDSLKITASGYVSKVQPITSYQGMVNVALDSSTLAKFSFFVTSLKALQTLSGKTNGFGGDFRFGKTGAGAGLKGADSICECIAEMSMPGSKIKGWRAFLSASKDEKGNQVNAIERIGQGPWYDRVGRVVSPDIKGLLKDRPDADDAIKNDLPNEAGVPNHRPDPNKEAPDNHHMVTGTGTDGKLYKATNGISVTCNDWTSKTADGGKPFGGLSWPRAGGMTGLGSSNWMTGLQLCGCKDSIAIVESGGPPRNCDFIGGGGGYGGFYCFALTP
jgi:hypothetical protein